MLTWNRPDLIEQLSPNIDLSEVQCLRNKTAAQFENPVFKAMEASLLSLPTAEQLPNPIVSNVTGEIITVGKREDLTDGQLEKLEIAIQEMRPWRKGPFKLFGRDIDAEWRSNLKWDRIEGALGNLQGRKILDVGCGNGYYMFRAAAQNPAAVLGIDPSIQFFYTFELVQRFLQNPNLQYDRLKAEQLYLFDQVFDVALCMGVLYHRKNPIQILQDLRDSIRVGGFAIIESQTIPGEGTTALFPNDRYAKSRNVFFMPTKDCLINWAIRAGFKNVELVSHTKVTAHEQRSTELMPLESLVDFLDPNDDEMTIEGYPAPWRTAIRAERQFIS